VRFSIDYDEAELTETIKRLGNRVVHAHLCYDEERAKLEKEAFRVELEKRTREIESERLERWRKALTDDRVEEKCEVWKEDWKTKTEELNKRNSALWFFQQKEAVPLPPSLEPYPCVPFALFPWDYGSCATRNRISIVENDWARHKNPCLETQWLKNGAPPAVCSEDDPYYLKVPVVPHDPPVPCLNVIRLKVS
jgi:hypothetical protein